MGRADTTTPWQRDTVTRIFSTNRTNLALRALLFFERGQLDVGAPFAQYWTEFVAMNKTGPGIIGDPRSDEHFAAVIDATNE